MLSYRVSVSRLCPSQVLTLAFPPPFPLLSRHESEIETTENDTECAMKDVLLLIHLDVKVPLRSIRKVEQK